MKKFLVVAVCVAGVAVAQAGEKQKEKAKNDTKTPACCAEGKKTEVTASCSDAKACCDADTKVAKAKTDTRVALLSPKAAEGKR